MFSRLRDVAFSTRNVILKHVPWMLSPCSIYNIYVRVSTTHTRYHTHTHTPNVEKKWNRITGDKNLGLLISRAACSRFPPPSCCRCTGSQVSRRARCPLMISCPNYLLKQLVLDVVGANRTKCRWLVTQILTFLSKLMGWGCKCVYILRKEHLWLNRYRGKEK